MMEDSSDNIDIIFWLNYHRITFGLIPTAFHLKLTSTTLKQLRTRRRSTGLSSIHQQKDRMLLGEWKKIAKHFCNIGPSLSEVLFFTFETLNNQNPKNQLIATRHELTALVKRQHRQFMRQRSVHFGQFLMFLWSQTYLHYPGRSSSLDPMEFSGENRNMVDQKDDHDIALNIIKNHLDDILYLLCDIKGFLKACNVDRLSYFLTAGSFHEYQEQDNYDQKTPLSQFFPFWRDGNINNKVPIQQVSEYLKERLMMNKAKYPDYRTHFQHVRRPGSRIRLSSVSGRGSTGTLPGSLKSSHEPLIKEETIQFCYGYHDETIVLGSHEIMRHQNFVESKKKKSSEKKEKEEEEKEGEGSKAPQPDKKRSIREIVKVLGCEDSIIYILCPLKYLEIRDCVNCTIISAPIQKIVSILKCQKCTYIGTCRIITLERTRDCVLNICSNLPPFVYRNNEKLVIGPYNTFYQLLETHLLECGINPRLNHFQVPYTLTISLNDKNGYGVGSSSMSSGRKSKSKKKKNSSESSGRIRHDGIWRIMSPKEFRQFVIPFYSNVFGEDQNHNQNQNQNNINPCVIPRRFGEAIQRRMVDVANTFSFIYNKTKDDEEQRNNISHFMNEKFKEWLVKTNRIKEITSLLDFKVDSWDSNENTSEGKRNSNVGEDEDDEDDDDELNKSGVSDASSGIDDMGTSYSII